MKIIKTLSLVFILLLSIEGLAKRGKSKRAKKIQPYVGMHVSYSKGTIYEEVRLGGKWKHTLFGVSYNKFPTHLWSDFVQSDNQSPAEVLAEIYSQNSPEGEAAPSFAQSEGGYHSFGAFVRHSFRRYGYRFSRKAPRINPHVELAVQYRMIPENTSFLIQLHKGGVVVDGYVGIDARVHRNVMMSADVGIGSVVSLKNPTNLKPATSFKFEVGAIF